MTHADPPLAAGRIPVMGGFVGATAQRRDDDARPRRLGFFGGDRRRLPRRLRDPDLDRRGRHAHRRSAHRQESAGRAALVVRRSVRARLLRRQGAASGDHSAGGGAQHSGAHPQFAARHGARHADHGGAAEERASADGGRVEEGRHGRRHHVDAHVDGARLPAPAVRGVRAPQDAGRRRHDLGGQRVGDDRRLRGGCRRSSRRCRSSRRSSARTRWRSSAWSATACTTIRALAAQVLASVGDVPLRMVSQAASRRNITFVIREADLPTALGRVHEKFFAPYPVSASVAGTRG